MSDSPEGSPFASQQVTP